MNAKANNIEEKAQELCEKLYLAAKKSKTRRFHVLFDKIYRMDFLLSAWRQVKVNKGSAGIDNESIEDIIVKGEETVLAEIQYTLKNKKYFPKKVKRVYIPKPDGRKRPLGIPTVRDRIVQASTKIVIEPIFEADFLDCSYGFRPNRCAHDALEKIRTTMNAGYTIVLDADIKEFFDSINHHKLLYLIYQRINDRKVLKYIGKWLKSGALDSEIIVETEKGTPQGGVISPLLANIYMHEFDEFWAQQTAVDGKLVRYADDFVILFRTEKDAEIGLQLVKEKLKELNLEFNEDKSKIVDTRHGKDGFDFLGFHHRMIMSLKRKRYYAQKWPSSKSMNAIRTKIRELLSDRRILKWSVKRVVRELNLILIGWMNYFKFGNSALKFVQMDMYVHEKMALWWSKKHHKSGRRWTTDLTRNKLRDFGVQKLSGNVIYWSRYSKA
jgi:group II intron reverse transcriptase/maturase